MNSPSFSLVTVIICVCLCALYSILSLLFEDNDYSRQHLIEELWYMFGLDYLVTYTNVYT